MISRISTVPPPEAPRSSAAEASPNATAIEGAPEPRGDSFRSVVSRLAHEIDRGERLVGRAVSGAGAGLDAGQLIALQAGIYRYSEAVDLASKLVDRAGSAVKTTLQGSGG